MQQHWTGYLNAIAGHKVPNTSMPQTAPYETSSDEKGVSGFLDLFVKQPQIQARYDAMKGTFEGPEAADLALQSGVFKAEAMPVEQKPSTKK